MKKPMETWSAFRGISWRCTKERQCLWMGIKPRGEGEREISRHDEAEKGERWPFGFGVVSAGLGLGFEAVFCRLAWV